MSPSRSNHSDRVKPAWVTTKRSDVYELIDHRLNPALRKAVSGKIVLVTGAGTGVGKAIAETFASAGAAMLILASRQGPTLEATKAAISGLASACNVLVVPTDVSNQEDVEELFKTLETEQALPDVLVNNSAVIGSHSSMIEADWDEIMGVWDTNFFGTYLCAREFSKRLNGRAGTLINLTSVSSIITVPTASDYGIGKTAVNRLTTLLQDEQPELRSFAIMPGGVRATRMGEKVPPEYQPLLTETPQLAAGVCLWLMTPEADFLKGRYLDCTWDLSELMVEKQQVVERDLFKTRVDMG